MCCSCPTCQTGTLCERAEYDKKHPFHCGRCPSCSESRQLCADSCVSCHGLLLSLYVRMRVCREAREAVSRLLILCHRQVARAAPVVSVAAAPSRRAVQTMESEQVTLALVALENAAAARVTSSVYASNAC